MPTQTSDRNEPAAARGAPPDEILITLGLTPHLLQQSLPGAPGQDDEGIGTITAQK
jgi:hypothetical protein